MAIRNIVYTQFRILFWELYTHFMNGLNQFPIISGYAQFRKLAFTIIRYSG